MEGPLVDSTGGMEVSSIHPGEEGGEEGEGLAAHELVGVGQACGQARHMRIHQRRVLHSQVRQRHHYVVAHLHATTHTCFSDFPSMSSPSPL